MANAHPYGVGAHYNKLKAPKLPPIEYRAGFVPYEVCYRLDRYGPALRARILADSPEEVMWRLGRHLGHGRIQIISMEQV